MKTEGVISKFLQWLVNGTAPSATPTAQPESAPQPPRHKPTAAYVASTPAPAAPTAVPVFSRCPPVLPEQLTTYWREALDYTEFSALNPAFEKVEPVLLTVPLEEVIELATVLESSGRKAPKTQNVNVVLCLSVPSQQPTKPKRCHPLMAVPAILAEGELLAHRADSAPVLNPSYLSPRQGKDCFTYAESDKGNTQLYKALKEMAGEPGLQLGWQIWWETCVGALYKMMALPAGRTPLEHLADLTGEQAPWELRAFVFEAKGGGSEGIKNVYSTLLNTHADSLPALYLRLCGTEQARYVEKMPASFADNLVGHIDECEGPQHLRPLFPLDDTQRTAVLTIANLPEGGIQAVNGPPGSGKTSMLRAVVASRWVTAALNRQPCPIIVACGATNQSVTNVIGAFGNAPHPDDSLRYAQRWIPDLPSYGGFLPSSSYLKDPKNKADIARFICLKRDGSTGFPYSFVERVNVLDPGRALDYEEHYMACARRTLDVPTLVRLEDTVTAVHQALRGVEAQRQNFSRLLLSGSQEEWQGPLDQALGRSQHAWPEQRRKQVASLRALLLANPLDLAAREGLMDLVWRAEAFHWAARYWEGEFLLAQRTRLLSRHPKNVEEGLRRLCMLLPCLVSTLHSVPNYCHIDADPHGGKKLTHSLGLIDLLVIDEAGQATPELAGAAFALARRAAVVGDLKQLPPIWNNTDLSELALAIGAGAGDVLEGIRASRRSVANGSTLGMARLLSEWRAEKDLGVSLSYHYRCKPSIIGYCNLLSYDGLLKTRTQEAVEFPEPSMGWVSVDKLPIRFGGSYRNEAEAAEIIDWVVERWPVWQQHKDTQGKPLSETVALITAYRPQANLLRARLDKTLDQLRSRAPNDWPSAEDVEKVTIGTVHQLQGAERPIVCFSLVEGPEQAANSFIDRDSSMLNVGVSRAKRSFIIFANPDRLFPEPVRAYARQADTPASERAAFTPTHQLGAYLLGCPQAQALYPKQLVLIEAHGKKNTLEQILGKQSAVCATAGALFSLPLGSGVDVHAGFVPRPVPQDNAQDFLLAASKALAVVDHVVIATDDDRMGEYIAWQAQRLLAHQLNGKTLDRVRLGAVTRQAVLTALSAPVQLDESKVLAEAVREVVDCLISERLKLTVGAHLPHIAPDTLKPFMDTQACKPGKIATGAAPGRVQAAILRLMLEEARGVIAQKDKKRIWAVFKVGDQAFHARLVDQAEERDTTDGHNVEMLLHRLKGQPATLLGNPRKIMERIPVPSADTLSIMVEAWQRYKLAPWDTMQALQALYDGSWSDSATLGAGTATFLDPSSPITPPYTGAGHPPVTPLDAVLEPQIIASVMANRDWTSVYQIIWDRYYAGLGEDKTVVSMTLEMTLPPIGKQKRQFLLRFNDEACVDGNEREQALLIHIPDRNRHNNPDQLAAAWRQLSQVEPEYQVEAAAQWTLSYDSLLRSMQLHQIGRPSTYASTLKKMVDNRLIRQPVDSGVVRLTATGLATALILEQHEAVLSAPHFTRKLSDELAQIESGEKAPAQVLGRLIPDLLPDCPDPVALTARIWNSLGELEQAMAQDSPVAYAGGLIGSRNSTDPS